LGHAKEAGDVAALHNFHAVVLQYFGIYPARTYTYFIMLQLLQTIDPLHLPQDIFIGVTDAITQCAQFKWKGNIDKVAAFQ